MVGESLVAARLESGGVTTTIDIEVVDGTEKSVGILASAAVVNVNCT